MCCNSFVRFHAELAQILAKEMREQVVHVPVVFLLSDSHDYNRIHFLSGSGDYAL